MAWRPYPNISPLKLAALSLLGVLVTEAGYIGVVPLRYAHHRVQLLLLDLVPFLLGIALYLYALTRLKNSVQNSLWPEAELEPLRRISNSGTFLAVAMFFFGIFALTLLLPRPYRSAGWGAWLLGMYLMQIANALKKPPSPKASGRIDWRSCPPLQSDHWGQR
jgi:hypothetical protein